jgi:hypothetical protein
MNSGPVDNDGSPAGPSGESPHTGKPGDPSPQTPGALGLITIGTVNATCWLAGIFIGWLADRHFHTVPIFILLGLVVGTVTGAASTYKEVRRYLSS